MEIRKEIEEWAAMYALYGLSKEQLREVCQDEKEFQDALVWAEEYGKKYDEYLKEQEDDKKTGTIYKELQDHWKKLSWWDKVVVVTSLYWMEFITWFRWNFQRNKYYGRDGE